MRSYKIVALAFVAALHSLPTQAQQYSMRLYPTVAPGSESWTFPEVVQKTPAGEMISNIRDPAISVYLPTESKSNGAAIVLLPGGAMRFLAYGKDTDDIIKRFNDRGVAVITLKYRTLQNDPTASQQAPRAAGSDGQAMIKNLANLEIRNANANPDPANEKLNEVIRLAVADGQAALRLVRSRAAEWKIDPKRVGMLGISAGGGVAIGTIVANAPSAAPNFFISLFGPSLQDVVVPKDAPPIFLATESTHGPVTKGLLALFSVWKDAGKSAELHAYEIPNFSLGSSLWSDRAFAWMEEQKIVEPLARR